jgi:hypothetical protein
MDGLLMMMDDDEGQQAIWLGKVTGCRYSRELTFLSRLIGEIEWPTRSVPVAHLSSPVEPSVARNIFFSMMGVSLLSSSSYTHKVRLNFQLQ